MQFIPLNYTLKVVEIANFMIYFVCVLSRSVTLCEPIDYSPARLRCPWGFSRHGYWSGLPCPSPGQSSQPRDRTQIFGISGRFLTIWAIRETVDIFYHNLKKISNIITYQNLWIVHFKCMSCMVCKLYFQVIFFKNTEYDFWKIRNKMSKTKNQLINVCNL